MPRAGSNCGMSVAVGRAAADEVSPWLCWCRASPLEVCTTKREGSSATGDCGVVHAASKRQAAAADTTNGRRNSKDVLEAPLKSGTAEWRDVRRMSLSVLRGFNMVIQESLEFV